MIMFKNPMNLYGFWRSENPMNLYGFWSWSENLWIYMSSDHQKNIWFYMVRCCLNVSLYRTTICLLQPKRKLSSTLDFGRILLELSASFFRVCTKGCGTRGSPWFQRWSWKSEALPKPLVIQIKERTEAPPRGGRGCWELRKGMTGRPFDRPPFRPPFRPPSPQPSHYSNICWGV